MVKMTTAVTLPTWSKVLHKSQSTDSLLKKLKELQTVLSSADELDQRILDNVSGQLVQDQLLFHKGKEVRASLACCLADVLRLCAPTPPFDEDQLQTVFQFFLSVLKASNSGLGKPMGPLFNDAVALLENLVNTKSVLLVWDFESPETFVCDYFTSLFEVMKPETPRKVILLVSVALITLITDGDEIPKKAIELLIAHFHSTMKRTNPIASHLAALVCTGACSNLQRYFGQYFADEFIKATAKEDAPALEQALQRIHSLIISINRTAPNVLVSVMPQVEDGLRAENDTLREASVRTLGVMFAEKAAQEGGGGNLAQKYPGTWKAWLNRCMDKNAAIRLLWTEATRGLIVNHPELIGELEVCVLQKLLDHEEKVRVSMVKVYGTLDFETLSHRVSKKVLEEIGQRAQDKRESVRAEALEVVGRAYSLAYPEIESGNAVVAEHFAWIPNTVVSGLSLGLNGVLVAIQHTFAKYILPLPKPGQEDEDKWTSRFLFVMQSLDDSHVVYLAKISNLLDTRQYLVDFITACQKFNGGILDGSQQDISSTKNALVRQIERIVTHFSDPAVAAKELNTFAKSNDAQSYKLMGLIMDSRSKLKITTKAVAEMRKKLQMSGGKSNSTMASVVRLAGFCFLGCGSIPVLLSRLQGLGGTDKDKRMSRNIFFLMKSIVQREPAMFLDHIPLLIKTLHEGDAKGDVRSVCLMALAKLQGSKVGTGKVQLDKSNIKRIRNFAIDGSHQEARYAAKLLSLLSIAEEASPATTAVEELSEEIAHDLSGYNSARLVASMAALKQFVKHANERIGHVSNSLASKVFHNVLMKAWDDENRRKGEEKDEKADEWVEDHDMNDELRARVIGVQFLTQRCVAFADHDEVHTMIQPVLKLLFACLTQGQPTASLESNAAARARFRSVAAASLLKLARHANCERHIGVNDFQTFATTTQDETFQVRQRFLGKLLEYWIKRSANLPPSTSSSSLTSPSSSS